MTRPLPDWYKPGEVKQSIRNLRTLPEASEDRLIDLLASREFDAPRDRVRELVKATPDDLEPEPDSPGQEPARDGPRPVQTRFVDVRDVPYLSTEEFATVVGTALSRYEGRFQRPEDVDSCDVDLYWHRQHTSVALRTVSKDPGNRVGPDNIKHVVSGRINPSGRTPSLVGVVTNTGYAEAAIEAAEGTDVELYPGDYVVRWLRDARLPPATVGTLLATDEHPESLADELIAELPSLPEPVRQRDPLGDAASVEETVVWAPDGSETTTANNGSPRPDTHRVVETPSTPGQRGELYADPEEDGDFGGFDEFLSGIESDPDSESDSNSK